MANTSLLGSYGGQAGDALMFRNRIINGDMRISQRYGTTTYTNANGYSLDRFSTRYFGTVTGQWSAAQSTVAPTGFTNSLLLTSTTAQTQASMGSSTAGYGILQGIEGFNSADFEFGTSSAVSITLSFWVRCSVAGTFSVCFANSAQDRAYGTLVTINTVNTWEYKTVTIPGDTTGTWLKDNSAGLNILFGLGAGTGRNVTANAWSSGVSGGLSPLRVDGQTINLLETTGRTFHLTGVQLEAGPTATPFERRPIGLELQLCQRYYERNDSIETAIWWSGYILSGSVYYYAEKFKVVKRAAPGPIQILNSEFSSFTSFSALSQSVYGFRCQANATATGGMGYYRATWAADAEL